MLMTVSRRKSKVRQRRKERDERRIGKPGKYPAITHPANGHCWHDRYQSKAAHERIKAHVIEKYGKEAWTD